MFNRTMKTKELTLLERLEQAVTEARRNGDVVREAHVSPDARLAISRHASFVPSLGHPFNGDYPTPDGGYYSGKLIDFELHIVTFYDWHGETFELVKTE